LIFVDTSFWVALRNRLDAHHDTARELLTVYADGQLITTNHVRGETWTYVRRRSGHAAAVGFLDSLAASRRIRVASVSREAEQEALNWLRRRDEREYSFVDATSFATMRALRVMSALAFDGDFAAAGFVELRA
jgi:predicted nucleic acid-binding protein